MCARVQMFMLICMHVCACTCVDACACVHTCFVHVSVHAYVCTRFPHPGLSLPRSQLDLLNVNQTTSFLCLDFFSDSCGM